MCSLGCHCKEKAFTTTSVSQLKGAQYNEAYFSCKELITFGKNLEICGEKIAAYSQNHSFSFRGSIYRLTT